MNFINKIYYYILKWIKRDPIHINTKKKDSNTKTLHSIQTLTTFKEM